MTYNTNQDVRDLTGLTSDDITNTILTTMRNKAEKKLIKDITIDVDEKSLEPNYDGDFLNGSNNTFYTNEAIEDGYAIADTNRDKTINASDVTVWVWSDYNNRGSRSEVTIDTVDSESGRIVLDSAPNSSNEDITASYSFYLSKTTPDWSLVELSAAYLTGHLALIKMRGKQPVRYSLGDFDYRDDLPGQVFLKQYRSTLNELRDKLSVG